MFFILLKNMKNVFYICGFAHILLHVNVRNDDVVAEKNRHF